MSQPAHLDADDAALYALGTMDDVSRRYADRHVPACPTCSRLVGEAEGDVAVLAAAEPAYQLPPDLVRFPRAQPPARIPGIGGLGLRGRRLPGRHASSRRYPWEQNRQMQAADHRDAQMVARLGDPASFRTAEFRGLAGGANARVMYAADGSWYLVLVRGASPTQCRSPGCTERTGPCSERPMAEGEIAMLYLPKSHRMDQLALMDSGQVVAEAQLAY